MNQPLIRSFSHLCFVLSGAICFAMVCTAHAQLTWDVGATVDSIVTDGSGDWDTSSSNWTTDGGATNTAFTAGDQVVFGGGSAGTAGTVTLTENITTQNSNSSITVQDDYTFDLSGFTLTPGANNQFPFTILGGASVTIDDTAGTGSYVTGVTSQAFSHSITGSLTINAKVTDADGLGGATNGRMSVVGGGSLILTNDANDFTGYFSKQNGGDLSFSSIADSGVASAAGAGDRVRIGFNARGVYTGSGDSTNRTFEFFGTNNGTLDNDGTGALIWTGAFENGTSGTNSPRTLTFGGSNTDNNEFQGVLADHASNGNTLNITKNDGGKWIFSSDNTYTGVTTITEGTLQADVADVAATSGALGNGGDITFDGGTLQYTANSAGTDYSDRIRNSASAMIFDTNGEDVTLLNNFADSNTGGLIKEGTGTLTVQAARAGDIAGNMNVAFAGDKIVNGGTLVLLNDDTFNLGYLNRGDFFINNGSTLVIADDGANRHIFQDTQFNFGATGGGTIDFADGAIWQDRGGANTFITNGGATNFIQSGNVTMQNSQKVVFNVADGIDNVDLQMSTALLSGSIEKNGAGTLSLTSTTNNLGSNSGVPNTVTISEGTLDIGGAGRLQSGNYAGAITNSGTIEFSTTANQSLSGIIDGTGVLLQSGSGTLTLSGANIYTGTTTVSSGTLLVDGSTATSSTVAVTGGTLGGGGTIGGGTSISSGATLTAATNGTPGALAFSDDLTLSAGSTWLVDLTHHLTAGSGGDVDQITVANALALNSADLQVIESGVFLLGETYQIASYGVSPTLGMFSNGTQVTGSLGGVFQINYADGGNFITLTAVPEPAAFIPLLLLLVVGFRVYRHRTAEAA